MPPQSIHTYLHAAIQDAQNTIRAIDVKLNVLAVVLLVPLASAKDTATKLAELASHSSCFAQMRIAIAVLAGAAWLVSIFLVLRGLLGLSNPANHIQHAANAPQPTGSFYRPAQFSISWLHAFKSPKGVLSRDPHDKTVANLPHTDEELTNELVYEHTKLACIRDLKLMRHRLAYYFAGAWLGLFLLFWALGSLNYYGATRGCSTHDHAPRAPLAQNISKC